MLTLNTSFIHKINRETVVKKYQHQVNRIIDKLNKKDLPGCEMTGWKTIIDDANVNEMSLIKQTANRWRKMNIKDVVMIGIGGSYTGVRAGIDMCNIPFDDSHIKLHWVHNMSSTYLCGLKRKLTNKKFGIVIISKSGTTLEPALAFRIFRKLLEKNIGKEQSHKYIVAITDYEKGTLLELAKKNHYIHFGIPNNIGGRFSTLTSVGLFPLALKGINPLMIYHGAKQALKDNDSNKLSSCSAYLYACYRNYLLVHKKLSIENFIVYDPTLEFIAQQWRQLFGESEGKQNKGLFPTYSLFTTDLHSMGQYLQEGKKIFFETTLIVKKPRLDMKLFINDDSDKLKYLNNKTIDFINKKAYEGTIEAHTELGKNDNLIISIDKCDAYHFGYLIMWFQLAVMMSGYLLKINPFDQPGVEAYKNNMFKLLGKKI